MNDLSVIAFYPGGGGNRYLRYLRNKDFNKYNVSYDFESYKTNLLEYRYLLTPLSKPVDSNIILTHCLNVQQIVKFFGSCNITILKTDFKKSLKRQWYLNGIRDYSKKIQNNVDHNLINSAWETINWHHNYYNQYPVVTDGCSVVDITTGSDEFSKVIQQELEQYQNNIFDFCWDIYSVQGPDAPIITLYDQHKDALG